ncbi:tetratricopeptide repeat protein [Candidatus Sumerlaeota bacterium]|nr:tetratricopeptide repeat protein [Candidatus Sumerlaeota bacterium]
MKRLIALLTALVSLGASISAAVSVTELQLTFDRANDAHLAGNHEEAVDLYEQLLEICPSDPVLLFNLGSARAALGQMGQAVWCYEMALRARPGWDEAEHNLALVRPSAPPTGSLLMRPVLWARQEVAPQLWSWVAVGAWALVLLGLGGWLALAPERVALRRALRRLTALGAMAMVIALVALALQRVDRRTHPPSIVVADSTPVRTAPGPEAGSPMGDLPGGTRLWEMDEPAPSGWVKIRTESGELGFVDQTTLRRLALP